MLTLFDKDLLIKLHLKGLSNSAIAEQMKISRPTVIKYVTQYKQDLKDLEQAKTLEEKEEIIIRSSAAPKYKAHNRKRLKLTSEVEEIIVDCLEENRNKKAHGQQKLLMKAIDIHELLVSKGFDISYRSVSNFVAKYDEKANEAYIRQDYPEARAAEFDWGEVTLYIEELGCERRFKIGIFTLKYSDYKYAYLYTNENTESFMDIHTKFFEHIGGVTEEIVYDNARVQVKRLAGQEKKPTAAVERLMNYYGFSPRYTNDYRGNEKGHVERAVEVIRRKAYCRQQCFATIEDAVTALLQAVDQSNNKIKQRTDETALAAFAKEKPMLQPKRIPLDVTQVTSCKVNKYSLIYVDGNFYSVPDYLSQRQVVVHKGVKDIKVFYNEKEVCKTKRILGKNQYKINIQHYLHTLKKKPGAIAHSLALKQANPWLQHIFTTYYTTSQREFIKFLELVEEYSLESVRLVVNQLLKQHLPITNSYISDQILRNLALPTNVIPLPFSQDIQEVCQDQLSEISTLYNQGGQAWNN